MTPRVLLSLSLAALAFTPSIVMAQADATTPRTPAPASTPQVLTILTQPAGTHLRLTASTGGAHGQAPLDLPSTFQGRFSLTAEGPSVARTQGVIYVPARGEAVTLLSEPRGMSMGLLVRSMNLPGIPDMSSGRWERGAVFATAGAGGLFASGRAHLRYRDRLKEFGDYAADRARDERLSRVSWTRFTAATWAMSALDYCIRPRFEIEETAAERVTFAVPVVGRGAIVWRSILVPGAGQEFANHRWRGALWLGAVLAAGAGLAVADGLVERDQTRVDWAEALVDSVGPSERPRRLRDLETSKSDLQSSEDLRRGFRYALIGTYLANVVDAMLVPVRPPSVAEPRLSASIPVHAHGAAVLATFRF